MSIIKLEEKIDKVDEKVDKLNEKLASIDKTLAINTESLVEHMRRTNLIEAELKPVSKHVVLMESAFKVVGVIGSILVFFAGILKILF
jgi:chromosome segregation ATPase